MFKTEKDFLFFGRKVTHKTKLWNSPLTNLCMQMTRQKWAHSRENLQNNLQLIFSVFKEFGLICHFGRHGSKSKTETMYFPGLRYEDADTSPISFDDGEVPFAL
jgi:hypothetical protein